MIRSIQLLTIPAMIAFCAGTALAQQAEPPIVAAPTQMPDLAPQPSASGGKVPTQAGGSHCQKRNLTS